MKLGLFSIRDMTSEMFGVPFCAPNRAVAQRYLEDLVADKSSMYGQHPDDFELRHIGYFENESGEVESLPWPEISSTLAKRTIGDGKD